MQLELSDKFFQLEASEDIQSELGEYLPIHETHHLFHKSVDPPSIIRLVGEATEWIPLTIPASVYLATLAKHAADATWNKLASRSQDDRVTSLTAVSKILARVAKKVDPQSEIFICISIPYNANCAAQMSVESTSPEQIARMLATFVLQVENISNAIEAETRAGRGPLRHASVRLQDDGSLLVSWTRRGNFPRHEIVLRPREDA